MPGNVHLADMFRFGFVGRCHILTPCQEFENMQVWCDFLVNIDVPILCPGWRTNDVKMYYGICQRRRHTSTKEHWGNFRGIQCWMMYITQWNSYLLLWSYKKNKITFIYVSWWSEACNDKGSTNHIMNMTVLIILLPDCFVTKLSVAFYQRRERIVEDEGFIYYFVFNTVSLKREKGCYKMERNQLCATINNVYY